MHYLPAPTSEKDLALMHAIDELHLESPFLGARQLRRILRRADTQIACPSAIGAHLDLAHGLAPCQRPTLCPCCRLLGDRGVVGLDSG